MIRKMDVEELDDAVRMFFRKAAEKGIGYILIEEEGKPIAGVVPPWQVTQVETARQELMQMIQEVWERNRDVSPEEIEREVEKAIREVRGGSAG